MVATPTGITAAIATVSSNKVVQPTVAATHATYTHYIRVKNSGGSYGWFGPYTLVMGCMSGHVTLTQSSITSTHVKYVGDSPASNLYTFTVPTSNLAWCSIVSNEITDNSNNLDSSKLVGAGSTPYTTFQFVSTVLPLDFYFKVKTTFTNGLVSMSSSIHA